MMDLHPFRQRTFRQRASIDGVGLHSGAKVRLTLAPAPPYTGIVFCSDGVEIPALAENVVDTRLNTSLGRGNVRIGTAEHVLAALCGSGIDNAYVEVEGPEVPILDAVGDLALLGMPVIAHFVAVKSGHALNHALVRKALAVPDATLVVEPRAAEELHEMQEALAPALAFEEGVA